ncbi:MAG: NAD(P)/FAD-dependent oxidoreductase [Clostridia bacterium]|nr:NAD(P)/FAD-dependent oxidoreductase [Clostridia bacterium]
MDHPIIVIGGGAAGLMAACTAAMYGKKVLVLEKMPRPARKIMITGKGRCNLTNNTDLNGLIANTCKNARFLYSAFSNFGADDTIAFFERAGVPLKTERGNRVFPVSDKAVDIVDALVNTAKKSGVKIVSKEVADILTKEDAVSGVKCTDGTVIPCESLLIATGGKSYPTTGSTGDGYTFAKRLGHTVTELRPSLVPMEVYEGFPEQLSGLSLKNVSLTVETGGKICFKEQGEMLFTHFGISGPLVLSASASIDKLSDDCKAYIDLKPALSEEQLDKRLLRDFEDLKNKELANSLDALLPKKLILPVIASAGIPPKTKVNSLTKEQRSALVKTLKALPLTVTALRSFNEAVVTRGGVSVKEIDPKTMQSKLVKGLFFAGEVIDVDAFTGGFNLQIAFSTGYLAGENM